MQKIDDEIIIYESEISWWWFFLHPVYAMICSHYGCLCFYKELPKSLIRAIKKEQNMIIDSDYDHNVWDTLEFTFIEPCKCKYCQEEFRGRFVEAVHERIKCPCCGRSLSWGER